MNLLTINWQSHSRPNYLLELILKIKYSIKYNGLHKYSIRDYQIAKDIEKLTVSAKYRAIFSI